jgi:hypothetical protein
MLCPLSDDISVRWKTRRWIRRRVSGASEQRCHHETTVQKLFNWFNVREQSASSVEYGVIMETLVTADSQRAGPQNNDGFRATPDRSARGKMSVRRSILMVVATAVVGLAFTAACWPAYAYDDGLPMNGTYRVISNGDWAKTNEVYHDEKTSMSTWTVSTTCPNDQFCDGKVSSDAGWSADIQWRAGIWVVRHQIPNWEPCANGTAFPGEQLFRFWPVDDSGRVQIGSNTFAGTDTTTGPSGACGINKGLEVSMPLRLDKAG